MSRRTGTDDGVPVRSVVVPVFVPLTLISSGDSSQEVIDGKVGDRTTEPFASILVGAEVLARIYAAYACFFLHRQEAVEGADDAR